MEQLKSANRAEAVIHAISSWLNVVGSSVLGVLVLLTVADVSARYFFNHPIKGTFELTELMMAAIVILGLGYTQATRGHVVVDLLVGRLPQRARMITEVTTHLLTIIIVSLIAWQSTLYALDSLRVGQHSDILKVPTFYFKFLVPVGSFVFVMELFVSMIESFKKAVSR